MDDTGDSSYKPNEADKANSGSNLSSGRDIFSENNFDARTIYFNSTHNEVASGVTGRRSRPKALRKEPGSFVNEETPSGTAFRAKFDGGSFAEDQISFGSAVQDNDSRNDCLECACNEDYLKGRSDAPKRTIYVCEACHRQTYCQECAVAKVFDDKDFHQADHELRPWRPVWLFSTPSDIPELDLGDTILSPEHVDIEELATTHEKLKARSKRCSTLRLFVPAPTLHLAEHSWTKLELHFDLMYDTAAFQKYWTVNKMVQRTMNHSGTMSVFTRRIRRPDAPYDVFVGSGGRVPHWKRDVKATMKDQHYRIDIAVPAPQVSDGNADAIEIAIQYTQEATIVWPDNTFFAWHNYSPRFDCLYMSTQDRPVQFHSPGEVLQVQAEQHASLGMKDWEVVERVRGSASDKDYQAIGKKQYLVRDLIRDVRWFLGKDVPAAEAPKS